MDGQNRYKYSWALLKTFKNRSYNRKTNHVLRMSFTNIFSMFKTC